MSLPIETTRLVLRRYRSDDLSDLLDCISDTSVAIATPDVGTTPKHVREYIECQNSYRPFEQGKCFDLAIELKSEKKVIGLLSLVREEDNQADIGYALNVRYRGQGFATEAVKAMMDYAFHTLKDHRIQADTDSHNRRAWELMERLGMRREGYFREVKRNEERWVDMVVYAILADEWQIRHHNTQNEQGETA